MEKYIALMRGVNVGGKNKVSMPELKALFMQKGFDEVVTYINSGNIIFASDNLDEKKIKEDCEALIENKFQINISIFIIAVSDLMTALNHAPSWWGLDKESKHNAIFILPPATVFEVFEEVGSIKPEYEKVDHYGRVVFWSAPIKTFSRTRWSKVVGSSVYSSITIRNANTVKKLLQLAR
ncbi:DUF1697 domain-containing protein [Acetobacterium paludosum]|uniref:DUF1697 domain-containing protein n=1 Tax=Acetobacterium paludosum TaxID=52693 RepID=A0A923HSE1_9FIRM|nr:DUF1697 domain-containing protein [Acetobacterium paludosum]MBC3887783.1 DUF1697 domain-containing protein [Acetobacterium paludosum]